MTLNTFQLIRQTVKHIPKGKVSTYGNIATALGTNNARVIGWALRGNQDKSIPCHRVVQKSGSLSPGFSLGGWQHQRQLLSAEGLKFSGRYIKNFKKHLFSQNKLLNSAIFTIENTSAPKTDK